MSGCGGITSNDVVGATRWPDASTGESSSGQQETVLVNALGQPLVTTDRNGNSHTLAYDILGRVVSDSVTTFLNGNTSIKNSPCLSAGGWPEGWPGTGGSERDFTGGYQSMFQGQRVGLGQQED